MASSSSTKAPCVTHGCKSLGILKCEGCLQIFCRQHVNEHRNLLSHQLDEIVLGHDTLQQTIATENEQEKNRQSLFEQIDKWERDSILKIERTAEELRQQIKSLTYSPKETVSKELQNLAEQLRKARIDDDYVETDLLAWTVTLEKLQCDLNTPSSSITISEDPTKTLIARMVVSVSKPQTEFDEIFGDFHGQVRIENNGHAVRHCGEKRSDAFVRGIGEYSSGKHKIQFIVNKQATSSDILFGIVSKRMPLPRLLNEMEYSIFGWWSNDETYPRNIGLSTNKNSRDLKGEPRFEIELLLDCDNQIISYFNERTKARRELNIDIKKCPFPWQLVFNLYNGGDQVRLIPSYQME